MEIILLSTFLIKYDDSEQQNILASSSSSAFMFKPRKYKCLPVLSQILGYLSHLVGSFCHYNLLSSELGIIFYSDWALECQYFNITVKNVSHSQYAFIKPSTENIKSSLQATNLSLWVINTTHFCLNCGIYYNLMFSLLI